MHIGFVALDYPSAEGGAGVGTQVQALARALVLDGHRVTVIVLARPGEPEMRHDEGVHIHQVHRGPGHWYLSKLPCLGRVLAPPLRELEDSARVYWCLRWIHRHEPFDVLEGTETGMVGLTFLMRGVPKVIRLHGERYTFDKYTPDVSLTLGDRLTRALQRVALRDAGALISPSAAHASEISRELRRSHAAIAVIPNALRMPARSKNGGRMRTDSAPVVLYVGRLDRVKGIPVLLEAAERVVQMIPEARFLLAGQAHPNLRRDYIEGVIRRHGLTEHVRLLGHVPAAGLPAQYRRARLCVLPSYYESFGLSALEPMAHGVPVVATAVGGLPEVVAPEETGLLVPPGDAAALSEAIVRIIQDPALGRRLGEAGRERARARFSLEKHVAASLNVYRTLTGDARDPAGT